MVYNENYKYKFGFHGEFMKERIIIASVKLLDNLGVKFTVDDIKNELKISKKTIYKYFVSKEELAQELFDYIIDKANKAQREILNRETGGINKTTLCLLEYMEIYRLQSEKIFNLYSLNSKLQENVKQKCDDNWKIVLLQYHKYAELGEIKKIDDCILRIIVEGIFKKVSFTKDRTKIAYECIRAVVEKC